jgi:hypothetical protein
MENINELKMDTKRILECVNYVEKQIKGGYISLGLYDVAEVEVVEQAIKEFKSNHGLNNI